MASEAQPLECWGWPQLSPKVGLPTGVDFPARLRATSWSVLVSASVPCSFVWADLYNGPLWELDAVEVVSRKMPTTLSTSIDPIELQVFADAGVDAPTLQKYLRTRDLALIVSRDVTSRDKADRQQPVNLRIAGTNHQILLQGGVSGAPIYDVAWLQIFQADSLRGLTNGTGIPVAGRRILPAPLSTMTEMPTVPGAPAGSVKLGTDGSLAAIVPARRGITWHLTNSDASQSIVKERFWVNFAPGEIRTCANCHGLNNTDQAGHTKPTNKPDALKELLLYWKSNHPPGTLPHTAPSTSIPKANPTASLQVSRTGGNTGPVSVNYTTTNGTATAGTDYTSVSGTLTWLDADTSSKSILVPLLQNPLIGPNKNFTATLTNPINGSLGDFTTSTVTLTEKLFDVWRFTNFATAANTAGIGLPLDDPDHDGLNNALEYAFALDPKSPSSNGLPQLTRTNATYGYIFTEPNGSSGVTYSAEFSEDLVHWIALPDHGSGPNHDFTHDTTGSARLFYRIGITIP